jgi:hypothetical protein
MNLPSVPIVLDKEYRLRFGQPDLISIEEKLGPVFSLFTQEKIGFNTARVMVWRGLHNETDNGALVHVFPLTPKGLEQAGDLVMMYTQEIGTYPELFDKLAPGFMAALGFGRIKNENESSEEVTGKNP